MKQLKVELHGDIVVLYSYSATIGIHIAYYLKAARFGPSKELLNKYSYVKVTISESTRFLSNLRSVNEGAVARPFL